MRGSLSISSAKVSLKQNTNTIKRLFQYQNIHTRHFNNTGDLKPNQSIILDFLFCRHTHSSQQSNSKHNMAVVCFLSRAGSLVSECMGAAWTSRCGVEYPPLVWRYCLHPWSRDVDHPRVEMWIPPLSSSFRCCSWS